MVSMIGHNGGPDMTGGKSWRNHCWRQAGARLLPVLPVEVVRLRVKRAAELGLDYRTYAGVRATTGRDLVAFLFSSLALDSERRDAGGLSAQNACLTAIRADRIGLAHAPLAPADLLEALPALDAAHPAPHLLAPDRLIRDRIGAAIRGIPADAVLLIGANPLERDWCATARLAGYLPAERYFATG